ncbi:hypothetical protein [Halobacillus shinanisalinarum]|uniref:hypothetical protein n=1 Tax=Halobacillus shinanisalinarum TaxID=2932258 RepID=UPI002962236A|nr:hypothetical protein [Halobacillus shinanisalinarum]
MNTEEVQPQESVQTQTPTPPTTFGGKLKTVGPGIVTAATGVGTGDLVAALVAGFLLEQHLFGLLS